MTCNSTVVMRMQIYLLPVGLALSLNLSAQNTSDEPAATKMAPVPEAINEGRVGYVFTGESEAIAQRVERLRNEVEERENMLEALRENLDQAEDELETNEKTSQGNANHVRDLIEAESELLRTHLERLAIEVKAAEDRHTEKAYALLKKNEKLTYSDEMTVVNDFLVEVNQKVKTFVSQLSRDQAEDSVKAVKGGEPES